MQNLRFCINFENFELAFNFKFDIVFNSIDVYEYIAARVMLLNSLQYFLFAKLGIPVVGAILKSFRVFCQQNSSFKPLSHGTQVVVTIKFSNPIFCI